jgi:hypothetical protein
MGEEVTRTPRAGRAGGPSPTTPRGVRRRPVRPRVLWRVRGMIRDGNNRSQEADRLTGPARFRRGRRPPAGADGWPRPRPAPGDRLEPRDGRSSNLAEDHLERGLILYRQKQYEETVRACDAALQAGADYPPGHRLRAKAHRLRAEALPQLKRYQEAVSAFEHCVKGGRTRGRGLPQASPGEGGAGRLQGGRGRLLGLSHGRTWRAGRPSGRAGARRLACPRVRPGAVGRRRSGRPGLRPGVRAPSGGRARALVRYRRGPRAGG